jgi:hypothetical protein
LNVVLVDEFRGDDHAPAANKYQQERPEKFGAELCGQ